MAAMARKREALDAARCAVVEEGKIMRAEALLADERVTQAAKLGKWRRQQQDKVLLLQAEQRRVVTQRQKLEDLEEEQMTLRRRPRVGQLMKFDSKEDIWDPKPTKKGGAEDNTGREMPPWWVDQNEQHGLRFFGRAAPSDQQRLVASGGGMATVQHPRPKAKWYD